MTKIFQAARNVDIKAFLAHGKMVSYQGSKQKKDRMQTLNA